MERRRVEEAEASEEQSGDFGSFAGDFEIDEDDFDLAYINEDQGSEAKENEFHEDDAGDAAPDAVEGNDLVRYPCRCRPSSVPRPPSSLRD